VRTPSGEPFDEVYQLAADMGGMGFIHSAECEIMAQQLPDQPQHDPRRGERGREALPLLVLRLRLPRHDRGRARAARDRGLPANPHNEYGWEKLYAERTAAAYGRRYGMVVRLARFQNCYGPEGTWRGGREKAPAAMCRKIAGIEDGGTVEVWGDGTAMRAYTFVDDMVDGIVTLMGSDLEGGVNIGRREYVSVDELALLVAEVAGKRIELKHVDGPVGVKARNFVCERIEAIGWRSKVSLREGLSRTYPGSRPRSRPRAPSGSDERPERGQISSLAGQR